jgi:hypothetical protein
MPREKTAAGKKWLLDRETRWTWIYRSDDKSPSYYHESRFLDGSASISLAELSRDWHSWTDREQLDFSLSIAHLKSVEIPDILRFLVNNGCSAVVSNIASSIAHSLPANEAAQILIERCKNSPLGSGGNFFQALANTSNPNKIVILEDHLAQLLEHPHCWEKGEAYFNDIANEVVYRIGDLIRLGEPKEKFAHVYSKLKEHPHDFTRKITTNLLAKFFEL